ncbi:MAG: hypothetical protein WBF38_06240 [Nitrosotalea sp.]
MTRVKIFGEDEFFEFVLSRMKKLDDIVIISQTPYMIYQERENTLSSKYIEELQKRFEDDRVKTTYYMSQKSFESRFYSISARFTDKMKIKVHIVGDEYFPTASIWIGKHEGKIEDTLIKLKTLVDNENLKPFWIGILDEDFHDFNKKLDPLLTHSKSLSEILINLKHNLLDL